MSDAESSAKGRVLWSPLLPLVTTAFFVFRVVTAGAEPLRVAGLAVNALWLVLAIYDAATRGRIRRWLHSD